MKDKNEDPAETSVQYDDRGWAETSVRYHEDDDTFEVSSVFRLWTAGRRGHGIADQVLDSRYRVTREGSLRQVTSDVTVVCQVGGQRVEVNGHVDGKVENEQFSPHFRLTSAGLDFKWDPKPVRVSVRGSVLDPLQPVNKLRGLRFGQRWRMPLVKPLAETLNAVAAQYLPGFDRQLSEVEAEVLPEFRSLPKLKVKPMTTDATPTPRRSGLQCFVVKYRGDDLLAYIWVRERDDVVLRQEVTMNNETLILDRD
jgi:hypothetical protein